MAPPISFDLLLLCASSAVAPATATFQRRRTPFRRRTSLPEEKCEQWNKQKAAYGHYTFDPPLDENNPTHDISVSVRWEEFAFAPWSKRSRGEASGGVYSSWPVSAVTGQSGYFGAQINTDPNSNRFIFSIWDDDRWSGDGASRKPKPSDKLVWPMTSSCRRNCQDCGLPQLAQLKKEGLTTGTQCLLNWDSMADGGKYDMRLRMKESRVTINTADYGGMPAAHAKFGELNRSVTGSVWEMEITDKQTDASAHVGSLLFESPGPCGMASVSMHRLQSFDEMIGCYYCDEAYHVDSHYGPFLRDAVVRRALTASVQMSAGSSCVKYSMSGLPADSSIRFAMGTDEALSTGQWPPNDGRFYELWNHTADISKEGRWCTDVLEIFMTTPVVAGLALPLLLVVAFIAKKWHPAKNDSSKSLITSAPALDS